jgi:hypothetical protein
MSETRQDAEPPGDSPDVGRTEREPLEELDALFGGLAEAIGGKKVGSVAGGLSAEDAAPINKVMRLVGSLRLDHFLTRSWIVIPLDDGERDIALDPLRPNGRELVHIFAFVLVDLPEDPQTDARVREFLDEANLYYGAKWLRLDNRLQAKFDLPLDGLTPEALEAGMLRLAYVIRDAEPDLARIGAGPQLESVNRQRGYPMRKSLATPPRPAGEDR